LKCLTETAIVNHFAFQRNFVRKAAGSVVLALMVAGTLRAPAVYAQSAEAKPAAKFETASIELSPNVGAVLAAGGMAYTDRTTADTRVDLGNIPLPYLIAVACRINHDQVEGPDWIQSPHFNVLATLPAGAAKEQLPEMLQSLLGDRLGRKAHFADFATAAVCAGGGKQAAKAKSSRAAGGATGAAPNRMAVMI